MSRERPPELPRALPDQRHAHQVDREQRRREELERLKDFSGPGFMGALAARLTYGRAKRAPQFVRRGYEAGILEELRDFYARRPRPWRPARFAPKQPMKERLRLQRRRENGHA